MEEENWEEMKAVNVGPSLFQKLLFVVLFSLFITFVGFTHDFVHNLLISVGLMVGSWLIVKLLWKFGK
jgi:hypothetical protein